MPADGEVELHYGVRAAERALDVAVFLVDDGGLYRCVLRVQLDGKRFDLERDELRRVFGEVGVFREHCCDRLTDVAHLVAREQMLAVGLEALHARRTKFDRRHFGDIGEGPHRDAGWRGQRLCGVDGNHFAVRVRRAHDAHVQLAGK